MSLDLRLCGFYRILVLLLRTTSSPLNALCADNPTYSLVRPLTGTLLKISVCLFAKHKKAAKSITLAAASLPVRFDVFYRTARLYVFANYVGFGLVQVGFAS